MPSQQTFTQWNRVDITTGEVLNQYSITFEFRDNADGNPNGETPIGDRTYAYESNGNPWGQYVISGTTSNGAILGFGSNYHVLFSNTSYTVGSFVTINTTDPYTYCFLEGTKIETPSGEQAVQSLKIGDKVLSADGRELTVRWMGHEKIINRIGASVHKAPVKISAGAFGNGLPHSDLYVSNAHAFLLDDHLVVASALINGDTITSVPFSDMPAEFTYWHIETDEHQLVVANGVAAETLAGAPERRDFDNYEQYLAEFGADRIIQPMAYPRIKDVAQVPDSIAARFNLQRPSVDWDSLLDDESASVFLKQSNG